jgi:hypothetical protein
MFTNFGLAGKPLFCARPRRRAGRQVLPAGAFRAERLKSLGSGRVLATIWLALNVRW